MLTLSLRRLLGGRGKQFLALSLLTLTLLTLLYRSRVTKPQHDWDPHTFPSAEHQTLVRQRHSRPPVFGDHPAPNWSATTAQQLELNQVIQSALRTGHPTDDSMLWVSRRNSVVSAAKNAWDAYVRDAFGSDEYHPMSHKGSNMTEGGFGYHIADTLDTLLLMGLKDEYKRGRDFLVNNISFNQSGAVSLFETTIRVLGGLLSAYHHSGETDAQLLEMARDLGERLAKSFATDTGIPPETAFLQQVGKPHAGLSSTAEVATLQLEYRYLAKLTNSMDKFRAPVDRIMSVIFKAPKHDHLVPIYINGVTGSFTGDDIRLGSRGDSYYEYLLKQHLQTRQTENEFRREYDSAIEGVKKYLVDTTPNQKLTFIGELTNLKHGPLFSPKMDHLVCFMGGNLALGATSGHSLANLPPQSLSARDREDLILARELTETCAHMYFDTQSGLAPEIAYFRWTDRRTNKEKAFDKDDQLTLPDGDILVHAPDRHNLLRPETVESLFILWRITKEQKWRDYGWRIFLAFEKWAKYKEGGYTSLHDVTVVPPPREDKMETFFMSETLKYLYLLFSDDSVVPLTRYVFNTEAHPLPVFT
ncbi:mannosyl-oligosaccharide alpha-1,2-mannosidase, partial [Linderina pennispora]